MASELTADGVYQWLLTVRTQAAQLTEQHVQLIGDTPADDEKLVLDNLVDAIYHLGEAVEIWDGYRLS